MKKFNLITIFCLLATVAVSVESFAIRSKTAPRRQPADTNSLASVAQTTSQEEDTDGSESVKGYEKPIESGSASSPSEEDSGIEAVPTSEETHPAPEPYSFSYSADTEDGASSTREETGDKDGRITGFYMLSNSDGTQRRVNYVADKTGFHATIVTNEAGTESKNPADVTIDSSAPEVVYPEGPTASSGSSSSSSRGSTSRTVTTSNTSSFRSPSSSRTTTSNVKTDAVDDENETEFGSSASTGSASSAKRPDTQIADNNDDENEENSTGFSNADEESTNVGSDFRAPQPTKSRQQPVARPASQPTKSQAPVQKAPQPIARPAPQPTKTRQQPRPAPQPTKTQAPVQRAPQPIARPAPQPIKTRQQPRPAPQPTKTQAPQPIARPAPQPTKTQRPQQVARTVPAPPAPRAQRPQPVARPASQPSKTRQQPIARPAPQPTKTQRPQQAARPVAIPQAPRAQRPQPIPRPAPKPVQTSQESTVDDEDNDVSFGSASEDQTVQQADSNSQYMVVPLSGLNHPEINNIIANRGPIVAANRDSGLWLNENQLRNLLAISNYRS